MCRYRLRFMEERRCLISSSSGGRFPMIRVAALLFVPALLGFAPVPPCRPMTDPDRAIQQLDCHACSTADSPSKAALADSKRRLIDRLEKQHARLLRQGEAAEAAAIRDYIALVKSVDADRPLGS